MQSVALLDRDVLLTVAVVLFFVSVFLQWLMLRRMNKRSPEAWKALGSRGILTNRTIRKDWQFAAFVWRGKYRRLGDPKLNTLALWLKVLFIGWVSTLLAVLWVE
jgi:hypothetical protein